MLGNKLRHRAKFYIDITNVELDHLHHEKLKNKKKKKQKVFVKFQFAAVCTVYFEGEFEEDKLLKLTPYNPERCSFWYVTDVAHLLKRQELKISVFAPSSSFLSGLDSMLRRGDDPIAVSESIGAKFDIGECKPSVDLYTLATKTVKHELGLFHGETSCGRVKFELLMTEICPDTTCTLDEVQLHNWEIAKTQHDEDLDEDTNKKELMLTYFYVDETTRQSDIRAHETKATSASSPAPAWMNFDLIKFHGQIPKMAKADIVIVLQLLQAGLKTEIGRAKLSLLKYYTASDHAIPFEEDVVGAGVRNWKVGGCIKFSNGPQFAQMTQGVHRETGVENGYYVEVPKKFKNPDGDCEHVPKNILVRQGSVIHRERATRWRRRNESLKQEIRALNGICEKYSDDISNMTQEALKDPRTQRDKKERIQALKQQIADADEQINGLKAEVDNPHTNAREDGHALQREPKHTIVSSTKATDAPWDSYTQDKHSHVREAPKALPVASKSRLETQPVLESEPPKSTEPAQTDLQVDEEQERKYPEVLSRAADQVETRTVAKLSPTMVNWGFNTRKHFDDPDRAQEILKSQDAKNLPDAIAKNVLDYDIFDFD